jgi:hypothetical protein
MKKPSNGVNEDFLLTNYKLASKLYLLKQIQKKISKNNFLTSLENYFLASNKIITKSLIVAF